MAVSFGAGLRAFCVAVAVGLAVAHAGEPPSPLIGATREQVLTRYGEPKSQMAAGNRVILYYARERIILRDGRVVEVEPITADTPPGQTGPASAEAATRTVGPPTTSPPASDSKVEIKLVRPPSKDGRPASAEPTNAGPESAPVTIPSPTVEAPKQKETAAPKKNSKVEPVATVAPPEPEPAAEPAKPTVEDAAAKKKKEQAIKSARRRLAEASAVDVAEPVISGRMYLIAFVVVAGGIGILYWRYRQRQLALAATSVMNTPLPFPASPVFSGNSFTADQLSELEWNRFEELVAAYYSKTGVVAVRTKTGPDSPVHIKISWKGEPQPFAFVQCIAHPAGLVDAKPLQALASSLATEKIRRGYVVTTGKFNVQARDFAEEKHLTLLPGDIFLEKLNALPPAARTEIMQAVSGDGARSAPKNESTQTRPR